MLKNFVRAGVVGKDVAVGWTGCWRPIVNYRRMEAVVGWYTEAVLEAAVGLLPMKLEMPDASFYYARVDVF